MNHRAWTYGFLVLAVLQLLCVSYAADWFSVMGFVLACAFALGAGVNGWASVMTDAWRKRAEEALALAAKSTMELWRLRTERDSADWWRNQ